MAIVVWSDYSGDFPELHPVVVNAVVLLVVMVEC